MHMALNLQRLSGMDCWGLLDSGCLGCGLLTPPQPQSWSSPLSQSASPSARKKQGQVWEGGQAYIQSKHLKKMSHTKKPGLFVYVSVLEDAHDHGSLVSNGSTGGKAGREALCRFPKMLVQDGL